MGVDVVAPLVHFGNVRGDLGQYVHTTVE
jgi:hypothetical protein